MTNLSHAIDATMFIHHELIKNQTLYNPDYGMIKTDLYALIKLLHYFHTDPLHVNAVAHIYKLVCIYHVND